MPIANLQPFLAERKHLLTTLPLSTLSDTRLGIDVSYYLSQIQSSSSEPLLAATGGLPLCLTTRIESDLRLLEKLRVKPVFVFNGLKPSKKLRLGFNQNAELDACRDRQNAWEKYEAGLEDEATRLFAASSARGGSVSGSNTTEWDFWRVILRVFKHRNVEFLVAPYFAWAQLIYLQRHPKSYIHAIYGPDDTLLFPGVDKVILSLSLNPSGDSAFTFVSKRAVLSELSLNDEQFLDVSLLMGWGEHCPAFPPTLHEQALKATVDMVKYYKNGHSAVSSLAEHPAVKNIGFSEHYARTRAMIRFSLILTNEGVVQPLPLALPHSGGGPHISASDIPADLHEVYTHRLPDQVFFYLSRGLVSPQALIWITTGQIVETPPLDNGETIEYKRFVKEVITEGQTGPRATTLALLTTVAHQFWSKRQVSGVFWFEGPGATNANGQKSVAHMSTQTVQLAERVSGWLVPAATVEEELRRQNWSSIDFQLCLGATATDKMALKTRPPKSNSSNVVLEKKDEIVANVIWRFLELRGFLLNSHTHSPLARAMHVALRNSKVVDKFQDPLYIFLELVRAGVMHGHLWTGRAFSGGPSFGTDDEKSCMLLIMRVLSIVPLNFKPESWNAPLSRELLVFNSFVRSLTRALRTLLETTTLNMLLRNDCKKNRDDLLDIGLSLPFQGEVNTGFGVLAKVYLDALTHINQGNRVLDANTDGVAEMKGIAVEICEETFGGVVRGPVKGEVERGFRFWDIALTAMRQLHSEGAVLRELIDQFEAAESWLAPMRP